ncbi:MAG: YbgC/FadM family acyl-CoA thioesterase [Chryseobacterium sp.]|nr:MAG: YbgC/FadM family acyl-CoA thioesterase [Chryseobacterium sp.]
MIHTTHTIRVRYAETDPMKYVYYGNYAAYFELGRVELFRSIGISYDEIEKLGIWLPVSDYNIKYLKPALYDQKLEIHTFVKKIPGVRIEFEYEIPVDEANELLDKFCSNLINKTRHYVIHEGKTWEVDVFSGLNEGLIVAEIELNSEEEKYALPVWVGENVTNDRRYANSNLALTPFSNW